MNFKKWLGLAAGAGTIISIIVALLKDGKDLTLEDLQKEREKVQADYNNPELDMDTRIRCQNRLFKLDEQIGNIKWGDEEPKGPGYHREHGYNLYKDD